MGHLPLSLKSISRIPHSPLAFSAGNARIKDGSGFFSLLNFCFAFAVLFLTPHLLHFINARLCVFLFYLFFQFKRKDKIIFANTHSQTHSIKEKKNLSGPETISENTPYPSLTSKF